MCGQQQIHGDLCSLLEKSVYSVARNVSRFFLYVDNKFYTGEKVSSIKSTIKFHRVTRVSSLFSFQSYTLSALDEPSKWTRLPCLYAAVHSVLAIHGLISGLGGVLLCGSCQQKDGLVCSELLRLTVTSRQRLSRHLSLRHKLTRVKQQPRISCFSRLLAKFSPSAEKYSQSAFGLVRPIFALFGYFVVSRDI